jgi:hypothetical protein
MGGDLSADLGNAGDPPAGPDAVRDDPPERLVEVVPTDGSIGRSSYVKARRSSAS